CSLRWIVVCLPRRLSLTPRLSTLTANHWRTLCGYFSITEQGNLASKADLFDPSGVWFSQRRVNQLDLRAAQPGARRGERAVRADGLYRQRANEPRQIGEAYALAHQKRYVRMPKTRRGDLRRVLDGGVVSRAQDLRVDAVPGRGACRGANEQFRSGHVGDGFEKTAQRFAEDDVAPRFTADTHRARDQIDVAPTQLEHLIQVDPTQQQQRPHPALVVGCTDERGDLVVAQFSP